MTRRTLGIFAALLLLTGCDHSRPESAAKNSSAIPVARSVQRGPARAKLVALPAPPTAPAPVASTLAPAPRVTVAQATPPPSDCAPSPAAPPAEPPTVNSTPPDSPTPSPSAATMPDLPATASTPPETNAPAIPATPPPATPAPAPLSEAELHRQVVVLETSFGHIVIQLDDVAAPRTCGNFRKLVSDGFYNHTIFHRVIPHFIIQGGDPNTKTDERSTYGQGDPGYTLPAEIGLKHEAGAVAMARLPDAMNHNRDSNGSQFFICAAACPSLDGQYTVFGHVISGMEAVNKIANLPRDAHDDPEDRVEMQAYLEEKGQALGTSAASQ